MGAWICTESENILNLVGLLLPQESARSPFVRRNYMYLTIQIHVQYTT